MEQVHITVQGIKKSLSSYDYRKAIIEYIWNGFDANATTVEINFKDNGFGGLESLSIRDNGYGIDHRRLNATFRPFFQSDKELNAAVNKKNSAVHGKNGVGRLTFFTFASKSQWNTVYIDDEENKKYKITVETDTLNEYSSTDPVDTDEATGTTVLFTDIHSITIFNFEEDILLYLMKEFGWFLELNASRNFTIKINGEKLDYSGIIGDRDSFTYSIKGESFEVRYVRWGETINREYSHYYFIGSDDIERTKKTTTLNNKGDSFYHSLYVKSSYFDGWKKNHTPSLADEAYVGYVFTEFNKQDEIYKLLLEMLDEYLRGKRKPFLRNRSDRLVTEYEETGVFPHHNGNPWDIYRHSELATLVRELYQVEPKIFSGLNLEQKKTFVHLLSLILDQKDREPLLRVIQAVVELDLSEIKELANILKTSKLSAVIQTIRLIEDRYRAIDQLKELVFRKDINANERDHLQKFIEMHYWIFGEEYHLVTSAEPRFEEALKRFIYILRGEKAEPKIDHPDKNKEMDIFMVRWLPNGGTISNVVVELKSPKINLGLTELTQVETYMNLILKQDEFNGSNMFWKFYLVGNGLDSSGYIDGRYQSARVYGEPSLVHYARNYKVYVKTWSEIFGEFELRHKFLLDQLNFERDVLINKSENADAIILQNQENNTATLPASITVPLQ